MKMGEKRLSHYGADGRVRMVDVSAKEPTERTARASAFVKLSSAVLRALPQNKKGNPLEVARIAGIQAAKRTAELIPLCHSLALSHVDVELQLTARGIAIEASATTCGQTGVEMEAMTAVAVAALTVYDMTKALDKSIVISEIRLEEKSGGKSGSYQRRNSKKVNRKGKNVK
jgi:cyclic pyranopterin phosphate synthase